MIIAHLILRYCKQNSSSSVALRAQVLSQAGLYPSILCSTVKHIEMFEHYQPSMEQLIWNRRTHMKIQCHKHWSAFTNH